LLCLYGIVFVARKTFITWSNMFFTGKSTTFRNKNFRLPDKFVSRGLLCMCMFCVLNTLFVVVITKPAIKPASLHAQQTIQSALEATPRVKLLGLKGKVNVFSKSILRIILENCFYAGKHASLPGAEADDEVKKVEYITLGTAGFFYTSIILSRVNINYFPFLAPNAFLDTLTPPPKQVA
jgi:hypothetical protein